MAASSESIAEIKEELASQKELLIRKIAKIILSS